MVFAIILFVLIALAALLIGLWFMLDLILRRFEVQDARSWAIAFVGAFCACALVITIMVYSVEIGVILLIAGLGTAARIADFG